MINIIQTRNVNKRKLKSPPSKFFDYKTYKLPDIINVDYNSCLPVDKRKLLN